MLGEVTAEAVGVCWSALTSAKLPHHPPWVSPEEAAAHLGALTGSFDGHLGGFRVIWGHWHALVHSELGEELTGGWAQTVVVEWSKSQPANSHQITASGGMD